MSLERLYTAFSKKFDNVILKNDRVWILAYGDLYVVKIKSGNLKVYRNWYNPFQLVFVALLDYLGLVFVLWLGHLNISSLQKFIIWCLLFIVSNLLSARNNKEQKALIKKIKRIGQSAIEGSETV